MFNVFALEAISSQTFTALSVFVAFASSFKSDEEHKVFQDTSSINCA
jgi:hypothetical protein